MNRGLLPLTWVPLPSSWAEAEIIQGWNTSGWQRREEGAPPSKQQDDRQLTQCITQANNVLPNWGGGAQFPATNSTSDTTELRESQTVTTKPFFKKTSHCMDDLSNPNTSSRVCENQHAGVGVFNCWVLYSRFTQSCLSGLHAGKLLLAGALLSRRSRPWTAEPGCFGLPLPTERPHPASQPAFLPPSPPQPFAGSRQLLPPRQIPPAAQRSAALRTKV